MQKISNGTGYKKCSYEQFRQMADNVTSQSRHLHKIQDVVEAIGYSRHAANGWQKAGQVPEAAIWAVKGYFQQHKNNGISFSKEELLDIISFLPESKPMLIHKAVRVLRNLS